MVHRAIEANTVGTVGSPWIVTNHVPRHLSKSGSESHPRGDLHAGLPGFKFVAEQYQISVTMLCKRASGFT